MLNSGQDISLAALATGFQASWALDLQTERVYLAPLTAGVLQQEPGIHALRELAPLIGQAALVRGGRALVRAKRQAGAFCMTFPLDAHGALAAGHRGQLLRLEGTLVVHASSSRLVLLGSHELVASHPLKGDRPARTSMPYGLVIDARGLVHDYFHGWSATHDMPADRVIGSNMLERIEPVDARDTVVRIERALATGTVQSAERVFPIRGELRTFLTTITPLSPDRCLFLGVDVTDEEAYRSRARQARYELERVTATVPGCVYQYRRWPDSSEAWLFVSEGSRALWGVPPQTLLEDPAILWTLMHPEDIPAFEVAVLESMKNLSRFDAETRLLIAGETRWIRAVAAPEANQDGSVTWSGFMQDVSAQKEAERERAVLEAQMLAAQKLESLGLLAGGIAHDFNNLLVGVLGNAALLVRQAPADSALRTMAEQVELAACRMAELTGQMLAYAGRSKLSSEHCELNAAVSQVMTLVRAAVSKSVSLEVDQAPQPVHVQADAGQITQVVMNLVMNGAEAIGEARGRVRVSTSVVQASRADFADTPWADALCAGQYACIRVDDNGPGMDAATHARAFDPFFTTKFTGRGLGLAAVLGILKTHRGAVRIESETGQGTRFFVYLPLSDDRSLRRQSDVESVPQPASGTVLIVDDEPLVRAAAGQILTEAGYRVELVASGEEAIAKLEREGEGFDAVLLDLTMPRMSGADTHRKIHALHPGLSIVFMSGYAEQEVPASMGKLNGAFVAKPFRPGALCSTIADAVRNTAARRA